MQVRTLEHPESTEIQKEISEQVNERGFYLYEWISPDELRMSVQADYLSIVKKSSIPLAIVTFIAGILGLSLGPIGVIGGVLVVLILFYGVIFTYLILKMIRRSYLYTRGADVIITDNHYVTGGQVIEKDDFAGQKEAFQVMERLFREPLFEKSQMKEYIALERKSLFDRLKEIMYGGGKMIEKLGRSRDGGKIVLVFIIAGLLYGVMMALVYFIGVFFVMIGANIFSWIAHRILLATNNLEHTAQSLFSEITDASIRLKGEKKNSMSLLSEAGRNAWKENLSGKLEESFEIINLSARDASEKGVKLQKLLETSKYRDIFNFVKYSNWIKMQILEPIQEILSLLLKNKKTIETTIDSLEKEIEKTDDSSLQKPLEFQKERLIIQKESFERMIKLMESYDSKLQF